jgi:S1-C subfamily serine protease
MWGTVARLLLLCSLVPPLPTAADDMVEVIERVKPSIVAIGTYQKTRSPGFKFRGTGFVVGDGTWVATNAHVLPEKVEQEQQEFLAITARTTSGKEFILRPARVAATDRAHDAALLKIEGPALPALALGDSAAVREGKTYAFTGYPIGSVLGLFPVTHRAMIAAVTPIAIPSGNARGLDTKVIRRISEGPFAVFQLDATAYPGNSGSPLYDPATGEVVGIVNMVFVKGTKEAALSNPSGISFAVPIQYLRQLLGAAK